VQARTFALRDQAAVTPLELLVVDDDTALRNLLVHQLLLNEHSVDSATDGMVALQKLANKTYDVVITDQTMPGMTGKDLAGAIKDRAPKTGVVLLSGLDPIDLDAGSCADVDVILGKPLTRDALVRALAEARSSALA
jgi:two-component system, OmpR family, response regulator